MEQYQYAHTAYTFIIYKYMRYVYIYIQHAYLYTKEVGGQIGIYDFAYFTLLTDVLTAHPARIVATYRQDRGGSRGSMLLTGLSDEESIQELVPSWSDGGLELDFMERKDVSDKNQEAGEKCFFSSA